MVSRRSLDKIVLSDTATWLDKIMALVQN